MAMLHEHTSSSTDDEFDENGNRRTPARSAHSFHMPAPGGVDFLRLVNKEEDEDEDEDDDKRGSSKIPPFLHKLGGEITQESVVRPQPEITQPAAFVELPLDVNVPPQEFAAPLPPSPAETLAHEDDDEDDEDVMVAALPRPPLHVETQREFTPEAPAMPHAQTAAELPVAETVVLQAAEQTVENTPNEEPQLFEAHAEIPAPNPNAQPLNHNTLPPLPPTPNAAPNGAGNGSGNGNLPPPGPGFNDPNGPPNHGFKRMFGNNRAQSRHLNGNLGQNPNTNTIIIERERVIERQSGEFWGKLAVLGLLAERHRRRGEDAKLDKRITQGNEQLKALQKESARQAEELRRQRNKTAFAEQRVVNLEQQAAVRQNAEPFAPEVIRPTAAAERAVAKAAEDEAAQTKLDPEQFVRSDAWRRTVMRRDSAGREVVDTSVEYGQAYHQERRSETGAVAAPRDAQTPGGMSVQPTASTPVGVPLPGAFSPSLPSGMSTPSLPGGASYQDPEHLLPAPKQHRSRDAATTAFLWLLVAAAAFAIVSGARLLF